MSKVGVSNFKYAKMTTEDTSSAAPAYGTITAIPGTVHIDRNTESTRNTLYADNGPYETASSLGETTLTLEAADLPLEVQADLLGATYDSENNRLEFKTGDSAPYVAVMFEGLKANGEKQCVKLFKGRFGIPNETLQTKGESVEFQTETIEGTFVALKDTSHEGLWMIKQEFAKDADTSSFYASVLPTT